MEISHIEHGIAYELLAACGKQSVVNNGGLAHSAQKLVERTVAAGTGEQIDAQRKLDQRYPTGIGLLAHITLQRGGVESGSV
jgi:hypothetical protein